jgi:VHL beta domain
MARRSGTAFFLACTSFFLTFSAVHMAQAGDAAPASKEAAGTVEAAFNSSKELGTVEAWNAFLSSYPTGFHAELARAYLKKLTDKPGAASSAPATAAQELSCTQRNEVHSINSDVPTKVTFVNTSGMYRSIMWIDFKGGLKDYGGLEAGKQMTLDTFVTHPWMIATGPGDCLQIFMPAAAPATIDLVRLAADDGQRSEPVAKRKQAEAPEQRQRSQRPEKRKEKEVEKAPQKKKALVCGTNYKLRRGECVLVQNCGSNAYRSPEGDCYCNKNYTMTNGKCSWKQDKQGFEVAPWKKSGCKGLQAQCSSGNNKACGKYEETCQVN